MISSASGHPAVFLRLASRIERESAFLAVCPENEIYLSTTIPWQGMGVK